MQKVFFLILGLGLCSTTGCRESNSVASNDAARQHANLAKNESEANAQATDAQATGAQAVDGQATTGARSDGSRSSSTATSDVKSVLANHAELQKRVEQFKGRVVVVDVWSTSCVPCMKEFPHLVELARRWPEDVVCISMNVDYIGLPNRTADSYLPKVTDFFNSQRAAAGNLINIVSNEPDSDVLTKLEVESMPAILITNRAGEQVAKLTVDNTGADGLTYAGDVVPLVEKLIDER